MNYTPTGMYMPGSSFVHKMNPAVKIILLIISVIGIVFCRNLASYLIAAAVCIFVVVISGIGFRAAFAPVKRLLWFILLIFLMNLFFFSPNTAFFSFWIFKPSVEGLWQGLHICLRVLIFLILSTVLTCTTSPMELTKGFSDILKPLSFIGIPTRQIAMILSVAMQFIPTLLHESDEIIKAQTARGSGFDSPKIPDKILAVFHLAVPVFIAAFRRADELSLAMESRGYDISKKK